MSEKHEQSEGAVMAPGTGERHLGVAHVDVKHSEVLANADLMNDAFDGENREHEQSLWQAAKSHPKACCWAFIMCFTIVSGLPLCALFYAYASFPTNSGAMQRPPVFPGFAVLADPLV